ncbi:hypothetical protein D3C75_1178870 [compost metagenome]
MAENTISKRVCGVTAKLISFVIPLTKVPRLIVPVIGGSATNAPGIAVNVLFGVADWYNCAVTFIVVPSSDKAMVLLK